MAAKIKDGLFIGDAETSQSEVFINDNKISNLINLAGREVQNVWASHGLVYLTYYWEDRPDYKLFSSAEDALLTDIVEFIDVSISHGISVLLFSRRGTGRCVIAACVYLMMKYRWGFEKTYDYVYSKKPDIDLNKGFIQQMFALDMKLLAARQKAYAAARGLPNTFKIEANMTINDISAMLPVQEAKRWNAWDPDYVLAGAEQNNHTMDGESKGEGRYRDSKSTDAKETSRKNTSGGALTISGPGTGEDDELILIYSFLNSKNTITMLPGPYLDVYTIPKDFKLKFNPVCYEEDVNWFPATNSSAIRGALKGCRARHATQLISAAAQPKSAHSATATGGYAADSKRIDAKNSDNAVATTSSGGTQYGGKPAGLLENIAPMYIINSQREREAAEAAAYNSNTSTATAAAGARSGSKDASAAAYYSHPAMTTVPGEYGQDGSPPTSAQSSPAHPTSSSGKQWADRPGSASTASATAAGQNQPQGRGDGYSNDLYEFVGIPADGAGRGKSGGSGAQQRTWGPRDSISVHRDHSQSSINSGTSGSYADYKRGEEYDRDDRNQRRQPSSQPPYAPAATYASGGTSRTAASAPSTNTTTAPAAPLSAEERLRNLMADMQRHKSGTKTDNPSNSRDYSTTATSAAPTGPSLYELATMQVVPGAARDGRRSTEAPYYADGLDEEDLQDPLSAFQRQQMGDYGYSTTRSSGSGAVRARHDVTTSSTGRTPTGAAGSRAGAAPSGPGAPRTAWGSGSRGSSPTNSRPASPSPGGPPGTSAAGGNGAAPGRYASPSGAKRMTTGSASGSVSSNLSVNSINSAGSNAQPVGSGTTSGSRVYRHGSPAPNTRPANSASLGVRGVGAAPATGSSGTAATSVGRQHILASSAAGMQAGRQGLQGGSIANSSVSSLGSGIVGAGVNGGSNGPRAGTAPVGGRYASPGPSATAQQAGSAAAARRGSNASAASLYSAESLESAGRPGSATRRVVGSSPLRGTAGAPVATSAGTTKRYSTPTPQSNQHYDFDSMASGGSAGSAQPRRSATPTKATWKF